MGCQLNMIVYEATKAEFVDSVFSGSITDEIYDVYLEKVGKSGEQIVIKSEFAFSQLKYESFDIARKDVYYVLRKARDDDANQTYIQLLEEEVMAYIFKIL